MASGIFGKDHGGADVRGHDAPSVTLGSGWAGDRRRQPLHEACLSSPQRSCWCPSRMTPVQRCYASRRTPGPVGPDEHRAVAAHRQESYNGRAPPSASLSTSKAARAGSGAAGLPRGSPLRPRSRSARRGLPRRRRARCRLGRRRPGTRAVRWWCRPPEGRAGWRRPSEGMTTRRPSPDTGSVPRRIRSNGDRSQPLITPSSPQEVHRHSIVAGTSVRKTARCPTQGRQPGRRPAGKGAHPWNTRLPPSRHAR